MWSRGNQTQTRQRPQCYYVGNNLCAVPGSHALEGMAAASPWTQQCSLKTLRAPVCDAFLGEDPAFGLDADRGRVTVPLHREGQIWFASESSLGPGLASPACFNTSAFSHSFQYI